VTIVPTIDIAPMRRRDLREVLAIEGRVYPRPWSRDLFLGELDLAHSRAYVVARRGHAIVGYAGIMVVADEAHVTTIGVDPSVQREGIGMRLMLALARAALARGVNALTLEVRLSNTAAQHLYRRFGFSPVGTRRGYYQDNGEDAVIMWAREVDTDEYGELLATYWARFADTTTFTLPSVVGETAR
jgi:ribosomal-protein-alanine N-acetyltransferase